MNFVLKISGSGNRFLLADRRHFHQKKAPKNWKEFIPTPFDFEEFLALDHKNQKHRKSFLKKLLNKAPLSDGLVVLDTLALSSRSMNRESLPCFFYNKDGSKAEMCGNAACCLSFYLQELGLSVKKLLFAQEEITLAHKGAIFIQKPLKPVQHFTKPLDFSFIDTGVPHGVIECPQLDFSHPKNPVCLIKKTGSKKALNPLNESDFSLRSFPKGKEGLAGLKIFSKKTSIKQNFGIKMAKISLKTLALKLRFKNIKGYKQGMNVSFYQKLSPQKLKAITFERGVEDWTLACGTGALAVSLVYLSKNPAPPGLGAKLWVKMPGANLKMETGKKLKLFSKVKKGF